MTIRAPLFWFPLGLLIVVQALFMMRDDSPVPNHALWGTDGYMRLVRVEALVETGAWFNSTIARANTPDGDTLHWTRPLDVLLLAGAAPLAPFLGWKESLYWWGVFISPVLHWLTLLALMWAARPLFSREGLIYLGVVFLPQPALLSYYAVARPDHHSLIGLLFVLLLGGALRLVMAQDERKTGLMTGAIAGLGLWVSVEMLAPLAIVLTLLAAAWLINDRVSGRNLARSGRDFTLGALLMVVLALIAERPSGQEFTIEYDRISVVHLYVLGVILAFWQGTLVLSLKSRKGRMVLALIGAVGVFGAIAYTFPLFFAGPYALIDARVIAVWFKDTAEVRPLLNFANPLKSLREILFMLGPVLLAGPWLWRLIRRESPPRRLGWGLIALGLAVFAPLTLYQARWATYAEILIAPAYAAFIMMLLARLDQSGAPAGRAAQLARAAARAMIVGGMTTLFLLLAVVVYKFEDKKPAAPGCAMSAMSKYLAEPPYGITPKRIMTLVFFGPEILYRSKHAVVGTPYQRNAAGILDTIDFFAAEDPAKARAIIDKRGIDLVMLCKTAKEGAWYDKPGSLFRRLAGDNAPGWLKPLALPDHLAASFRLYAVVPAGR